MVQKLLPQFRRQIGLGIVEQGSDVILQGTLSPTLIINEVGLAPGQHHIARLEVAIEKVIVRRTQQELCQPTEVIFQSLFIEGNSRQPKKVILEVVQVPVDRL